MKNLYFFFQTFCVQTIFIEKNGIKILSLSDRVTIGKGSRLGSRCRVRMAMAIRATYFDNR